MGYYRAKIVSGKALQHRIDAGYIAERGNVSAALLIRIERGVEISDETEPHIKSNYKARKPSAPKRILEG
jgi:hypothetical protein